MNTLQVLNAARALISRPNGWVINVTDRNNKDGTYAHCAQGAVLAVKGLSRGYNEAFDALVKPLRRKYETGTLPTAVYGGGGTKPKTWEDALAGNGWYAIAQFNNSTSQAEVVALFDEAIADEEAKLAPKLVDLTPKPVKAPPVRERELELA